MSEVNPYYGRDRTGRPNRIKTLFDRIAPRYDLMNDLQSLGLHRRWKERLVDRAAVRPGERALDLCCGTGDIARLLTARKAQVTGVDFSPRMLELARNRTPRDRTEYLEADVLALPFPDRSFDIVTCAFGLRNLTDFDAALDEMIRVLRHRGRLLILDFGKPKAAWLRRCWFASLRCFPPLLGRLVCRDAAAYSYILESLEHYPSQSKIGETLRRRGLDPVDVHDFFWGTFSLQYAVKPKRIP